MLCSIIFPVYKLWALILTAVLSGIASYLTYMVLSSQKPSAEEIKQEQENISYGPKVDPIVKEGRMALAEMGRLYKSIEKPEIRSRINELMQITDKIIQDAIEDPSDVPQIKQFMNYYLPTTLKLLDVRAKIEGEISTGKSKEIAGRISEAISQVQTALHKQLDALNEYRFIDLESEMDVLSDMLRSEGLTEEEKTVQAEEPEPTELSEEELMEKIGDWKLIFAGFNALTTTEERIINTLIKNGKAEILSSFDYIAEVLGDKEF